MLISKTVFIIIFFMCVMIKGLAQKNDASLWPTLSIEKKLYKNISLKLTNRARISENFSRLTSYYHDIGLYLQLFPNCKISADYVFTPNRLTNGSFRNIHQYYLSINNRYFLNAFWYLKNRMIFQHSSSYLFSDNGYKPYSKTNIREKISIGRKITRRKSIYLEDELMAPLKNNPFEIKRNRLYTGITHHFNKQMSLDIYFILQSLFHQKITQNNYIYGFTINYNI